MQRGRLSIYGRKNFIALVNHHLFSEEVNNPGIIKENFLFDAFPKALTDKVAILASVVPVSATGQIINSGVVAPENLPDEILIENPGEKKEFSLGEVTDELTLTIKSSKPYDSLSIIANDQPQADAVTNTNTVKLKLVPGFNLFDGINTYTVHGMGEESDEMVTTINIYYRTPYVTSKDRALKVIYYSGDPLVVRLVASIRTSLGWE